MMKTEKGSGKRLAFPAVVCYTIGRINDRSEAYAASDTALGTADAAVVSGTAAACMADSGDENGNIFGKRRNPLADGVCLPAVSPADKACFSDGIAVTGVFSIGLQCFLEKSGGACQTV